VSTTMAFARLLRNLLRDGAVGKNVVPIIPDEGRTFGMDALFTEFKIYAPGGQQYTPVDADLLLSYAESQSGQILEEGITEAGSTALWQAAATSYATWSTPMIPFYLFYSMFGFQRVGDLIWQCADARGRGFLLGCTAGRTTMSGEGLQHEDGQSHLLACAVPNVIAYDPAFAYEVAFVVEEGIRRMTGPDAEDVIFYVTLYNENYEMPALAEAAGVGGEDVEAHGTLVREGVLHGMYRFAPPASVPAAPAGGEQASPARRATLFFSGTSWRAAMKARDLLAADWDVAAEAWSVTSYKSLHEDALEVERWNRLHPGEAPRASFLERSLAGAGAEGPVVAVTDYVKALPDQLARFVPAPFTCLGTDGFGRSDTRDALRRHFEVDAEHIVVATLAELVRTGDAKPDEVAAAIARYGLDVDAVDPRHA
jgi:pyruvate dehydrogenase E1 component